MVEQYPQVAARNLELGILNGFVSNGARVQVIGSFPSSTFPSNRKLLFGFSRWHHGSVECTRIPFINLPGAKLATRLIASVVALLVEFIKNGRPNTVFVYSAHTPYLLSAFMMQKLLGVSYFVMIPDLPQHMNQGLENSLLRRTLKKVDEKLITHLIAKASGVAAITKYILSDVQEWKILPSIVIEGVFEDRNTSINTEPSNGKPYFLYSGGLNETYGVGELVRAFAKSELDAELWICGSGPLSAAIRKYAESDPRIKHLGFLSLDRVATLQRGAVGLLITRPIDDPYVRYSFPSKLLEYMGAGVPVLTTKLPGIPDEYFEFLTIIHDYSPAGLVKALAEHLSRDPSLRQQQGEKALNFVMKNKTPKNTVAPLLRLLKTQRRHSN